MHRILPLLALCALISIFTACQDTARATPAGGTVVMKTAAASGGQPHAAGRKAATDLKAAFGAAPLKAVLLMDSFEDKANKQELLRGVAEVLPGIAIVGGSCYGGFTQQGSIDQDGVLLLGLGGDGLTATAALVTGMGAAGLTPDKDAEKLAAALGGGGERLAQQLPGTNANDLLLVVADAHSPKNQLFLDGMQKVTGPAQRIAGGSVNKNPAQNWVYHNGTLHSDAAVGLRLGGGFTLTQAGQQAKTNDAVIESARACGTTVLASLKGAPVGIIVFDCAGRKGKLERLEDELAAIQVAVGRETPLFGVYCAGEIGALDATASPVGKGWHAMFTVLGR
jgi:hypothetical protein